MSGWEVTEEQYCPPAIEQSVIREPHEPQIARPVIADMMRRDGSRCQFMVADVCIQARAFASKNKGCDMGHIRSSREDVLGLEVYAQRISGFRA